jgi:hypothetical protein
MKKTLEFRLNALADYGVLRTYHDREAFLRDYPEHSDLVAESNNIFELGGSVFTYKVQEIPNVVTPDWCESVIQPRVDNNLAAFVRAATVLM